MEIPGDFFPVDKKGGGGFFNFQEVEEFSHCNHPTYPCEEGAKEDDYPAVEGQRFGDSRDEVQVFGELIVSLSFCGFLLAKGDHLGGFFSASFGEGGEFDGASGSGDFGDLEFIDFADKSGEFFGGSIWGFFFAEEEWGIEGGQGACDRGDVFPIDPKGEFSAPDGEGEMTPGIELEGWTSWGANRAIGGGDLGIGDTVIEADDEGTVGVASGEDGGIGSEEGGLDPERNRGRAPLDPSEIWSDRDGDGVETREANASRDGGGGDGKTGIFGVVGAAGGVGGSGSSGIAKVIDEKGFGIVGGFGIAATCHRLTGIARIHPEGDGSARFEIGETDPSVGFVEQSIEAFEVKFERSFVVSGDEADIASVFASGAELEVAFVEADEDDRGTDGFGDGAGGGVDGDFFAGCPVRIPPGVRLTGEGEEGEEEKGEAEALAVTGEEECEWIKHEKFRSRPKGGR